MTSPIQVTVKPTMEEVRRDFQARATDMANFLPVYKKAAILFDGWVQRNFKDEGRNLGPDAWPGFQYGGRINAQGKGAPVQIPVPWGVVDAFIDPSAKMLQKTGRLKFSFLPFADKDNAGIGSELAYAEAHHGGLGFLPRRRLLPKEADVHDDVEKLLHAHGMKTLKGKK